MQLTSMLALQLALFLVPPLALALTVYHRDDVWIRRWIMHRDTKDYLGVVHSHFEERSKILTPQIEPSNASTPAAPSQRPFTLPMGRWHIALNELKIIKENEATTGDNCTATKITLVRRTPLISRPEPTLGDQKRSSWSASVLARLPCRLTVPALGAATDSATPARSGKLMERRAVRVNAIPSAPQAT